MAALQRAIALAQVHHMAVAVGQHLHLDMARLLEIFLHIDGVVGEGGLGFGARGGERELQIRRFVRHFHAAAAAARRRLDEDGIADVGGDARGLFVGAHLAVGTGNRRDAERLHGLFGGDLVAHQADMLGLRSDEGDAVFLHDLGEARILRQKAVARMDRLRAGDLAGRDDGRNIEIGLRRGRRPDAHALVGQAHMHGVGVGGGMHRNGGDPHFFAGAVDAQRDLATVRNEDFFEHHEMTSNVWPNSTGSASCTRISVTLPPRGLRIGFIVFIASTIRSVSPS